MLEKHLSRILLWIYVDVLYLKFCSGFALISDGYQNNLMCASPYSGLDCIADVQKGQ